MSLQSPKVTVLMPAFNSQSYLREALDSILNQDFEDFECVIVNDGSTDETPKILDQYVTRDQRVRVIDQENQGIASALNTGLGVARGKYIAEMDHDDVSMLHRLRVQAEFLDAHPGVVLVAGGVELINTDGSFMGTDHPLLTDSDIRQSLFCGNPLHHGSVMYRRVDALRVGGYRDGETVEYIHDFDLWLRLADIGQFAAVPRVVFRYRIHPNAITASFRDLQDSRIKTLIDRQWEVSTPPITDRKNLRVILQQYGKIKPQHYAAAIQRRVIADRMKLAKKFLQKGHSVQALRQLVAILSCGRIGIRFVLARQRKKLRQFLRSGGATPETPWSRARERK